MNLYKHKKTVFTGGLLITLAGLSPLASANIPNKTVFVHEKNSPCETLSQQEFAQLELSLFTLTPDMQEKIIHAEQIYVCFDNLGIVTNIVPLNQMSAGIENL